MKIIEYENFKVQPLSGALGAEILDIDLRKINDDVFEEIYKAFVDYQVIGFSNQSLSSDEYLKFGKRWGEIHHYPYMKGLETHPEILELLKTETDTYAFGNVWHSDGSFTEVPPKATMLYAQELPPAGGDTLFADMGAVVTDMSEPFKKFLRGLTAHHSLEHGFKFVHDRSQDNRSELLKQTSKENYSASHPVLRAHPITGKEILCVNASFTEHVNELSGPESKNLLDFELLLATLLLLLSISIYNVDNKK